MSKFVYELQLNNGLIFKDVRKPTHKKLFVAIHSKRKFTAHLDSCVRRQEGCQPVSYLVPGILWHQRESDLRPVPVLLRLQGGKEQHLILQPPIFPHFSLQKILVLVGVKVFLDVHGDIALVEIRHFLVNPDANRQVNHAILRRDVDRLFFRSDFADFQLTVRILYILNKFEIEHMGNLHILEFTRLPFDFG